MRITSPNTNGAHFSHRLLPYEQVLVRTKGYGLLSWLTRNPMLHRSSRRIIRTGLPVALGRPGFRGRLPCVFYFRIKTWARILKDKAAMLCKESHLYMNVYS